MRHNIILKGFGCVLRPVTLDDSEFIVNLRNQDFAQGMIHATSCDIVLQDNWTRQYFEREDDYYWIICADDERLTKLGTIGLYDFSENKGEAMPGRWVVLPQAKFNILTPIYLIYQFAFESLGVKKMVMDVVAANKKVRRFHELYGAVQIECPARYRNVEKEVGRAMVWYEFPVERWQEMKSYWRPVLEVFL